MHILIDECLDWRLGRALTGHDCVSVQKMGWGGITNGKLLTLAQAEFDVFLTADRNLSFQQNTTKFQIAVVVLVAGSTQPELCNGDAACLERPANQLALNTDS